MLDPTLIEKIQRTIREKTSPRHKPDRIFSVDEIPYTLSGKKLEVPVKRILQGQDPEDECGYTTPTSCGTSGNCSGTGSCEYWPSTQVCDPVHCDSGQPWILHTTDYCSGTGFCSDSGTQDCLAYVCENNACRTDCANDADCRSGNSCLSSNCCSIGIG